NSFTIDATGGGTIKLGETIDLHVTGTGSQQTSFSWSPTFGMPCTTCTDVTVQPGHSTLYTVTAIDTNGCEAQDTVSVEIIEDHEIFTPNAFSPNGDGNNDYLQLFGNLAGIKTFELLIFDRWGEKVFETTEPTFSWDGTYKGEPMGPTVCVYVMNIVFLDGYREATRKGSLTLIR
ncbi:MAG TPA: gliding motility-associated C-terminal domain-containing protein, partial [Chitinophagales bacterium]|nr:gliding motility-associated C-terminal domain-containing protein [Chitinophagales bacterium]